MVGIVCGDGDYNKPNIGAADYDYNKPNIRAADYGNFDGEDGEFEASPAFTI